MKRFFSLLISSLLLAASLPASEVVNRSLAVVNGEPILQSEFEKTYAAMTADMPEKVSDDVRRENKKKLLDNLIDQKLLLQEAKKRKLKVGQRDLEVGMLQVKARFLSPEGRQALQKIVDRQMAAKGPEAQGEGPDLTVAWKELETSNPAAVREAAGHFSEQLGKEGLSEKKFEDRIKDQLLANQLTQSEVRSKVKSPSEDETKALFDKVLQVMQGKTAVDADSGDLGELAHYFSAQTGEKVRARHILVQAPKDASFKDKAAAKNKIQDIKKKIDGGADFADMAQKFSDDKPSAEKGGDLGVLTRGGTTPAFEKAAFELPVGKVSDVVETDFGYHLILVEEKKAASKLRYEDAREDLADFLMNNQGRKIVENFLKDLRKDASIKINVENLDSIGGK